MAVCRFYQQGYCKFGSTFTPNRKLLARDAAPLHEEEMLIMSRLLDSCRYEHPNAGGNRNQPSNRFGSLGGTNTGANDSALSKYSITPEVIEKDLTSEAPQWILSAYAPGRDAPDQLFGGYPREQSFEELRLHYLMGQASGNEQQALNEAQQLYQNAKQQMESAARNPTEAARFIVEGENRHPNRHDICREGTQGAPFGEFAVGRASNAAANPFGGNTAMATQTTANAFGQPTAPGQRPNPFGQSSQSAFGQPTPSSSAFGQPAQTASAFGQPQSTSAFGQPSALGAKPSPFGAPAFGQASQPNAQPSSFAQPQTQGNAFGQPGQLGQKPSPFGSVPGAGTSPFAATNTGPPPAANPFASSGINQGGNAPNPFGSNIPSQSNNAPGAFAQPAQPAAASPFGQPSATAANPFASTNQGPTATAAHPFAQQQQQQQQPPPQTSPFGARVNQASGQSFGQSNASPFGQQQQASINPFAATQQPLQAGGAANSNNPYPPNSSKQHPPIESYSTKTMDGRLATFKGKPVTYQGGQPGIRAFDGTWTRIWFPNGPPGYNKDTELPVEEYSDAVKKQWAAFAQTGVFADGLMPELPPPRECTQWDF